MGNGRGPLAQRDGGNLLQWHHHIRARNRDGQALDVGGTDPIIRVQSHGDIARLAGGVDPVAHLDAGKSHPQSLGGITGGNAQGIGQPSVQFDLKFVLRVLL